MKVSFTYGLTALSWTTLWAVINSWLLYFYLPPEGKTLVPATLYSILMLILNIIDAIITLPIGYWSDHLQSRWGRRLPLMFFSALPMAVFFALLWIPPIKSESVWNLLYLGIFLLGFRSAANLYQISRRALLPDIAATEQARIDTSVWSAGFELMGTVVGSVSGMLIDHLGYIATNLLYAITALPFFYLPFFILRERPRHQTPVMKPLNLRQGIITMLNNRALLYLTVTLTFCSGAAILIQTTLPFIVTEICLLTKSATMYFYGAALIASLICYPIITILTKKWGQQRILLGSLLVSSVVLLSLLLIGEWLHIPLLIPGLIWITLEAVAMSPSMILRPALIAEIVDYDEMLTQQRREGMYYAIFELLGHITSGVMLALLPILLLLGRSHTDPYGPLGIRITGIIGAGLMVIAFLFMHDYPSVLNLQMKKGDEYGEQNSKHS
ncbi:MAG: MFS transporter [Anaerolineae bacterium]|nr:MFS transporter [Anaerolineae bacterium]